MAWGQPSWLGAC